MAERGSERLTAERIGEGARLTKEDLQRIVDAARDQEAKIVNWWIYGQPAIDGVVGVANVGVSGLGAVVQGLATVKGIPLTLRVFPYGIPVVDGALVEFTTPGARSG